MERLHKFRETAMIPKKYHLYYINSAEYNTTNNEDNSDDN